MKCVIGLGNPEPEYSKTRHNIGKDLLNYFADNAESLFGVTEFQWQKSKYVDGEYEIIKFEEDTLILIKPDVFMNDSGICVSKALKFFELEPADLMIAYDELDLVAGDSKIAFARGSRIHNGIISIKGHLRSEDFWHFRIGVRNDSIPMSVQKAGIDSRKYVLSKFDISDSEKIYEMFKTAAATNIKSWLSKK